MFDATQMMKDIEADSRETDGHPAQAQPDAPALTASQLAKALTAIKPASSHRSAVDALGGVKLTGDPEGGLRIAASSMTLDANIPASDQPHPRLKALVDLTLLAKVLKTAGNKPIELLGSDDGGLEVQIGEREIVLPGLRHEDFPPVNAEREDTELAIECAADALRNCLLATVPAISKDETRPVLRMGQLRRSGHHVEIVATDAYRLHVGTMSADALGQVPTEGILMPGSLLEQLIKRLRGADRVRIEYKDTVTRAIIDGQEAWAGHGPEAASYPKYQTLIPDNWDVSLFLPREEALEACKAIDALSRPCLPLVFKPDTTASTVTLSTAEGNELHVSETLHANAIGSWQDAAIGYNPEYMAEALACLVGGEVTMHLLGLMRPGLLEDEMGTRCLLMPIRLEP